MTVKCFFSTAITFHTRVYPNTHIRVMGNTLIRVFIITLIWVLKAVSNKQERTTLNNYNHKQLKSIEHSRIRTKLSIPGSYKGKEGVFEFIKEPNGDINHRLFKPN